jgi:copper chaperone CopZ
MTAILVHEVPCRLRLRVHGLKHDRRRAALLRGRVAAVPGVAEADASPLTGSLIVVHDGQAATRERIAAALQACGHPVLPSAPAAPAAVHRGAAHAGVHPLLRIAAEALLERLMQAALAAVV